eukprot:13190-Heterococcus_DN1.PRE.1
MNTCTTAVAVRCSTPMYYSLYTHTDWRRAHANVCWGSGAPCIPLQLRAVTAGHNLQPADMLHLRQGLPEQRSGSQEQPSADSVSHHHSQSGASISLHDSAQTVTHACTVAPLTASGALLLLPLCCRAMHTL